MRRIPISNLTKMNRISLERYCAYAEDLLLEEIRKNTDLRKDVYKLEHRINVYKLVFVIVGIAAMTALAITF